MIKKNINFDSYTSLLYGNGFALDVYLPSLINLGIKKIFIDKNQIKNTSNINILKKYKEYIIELNEEEIKEQIFDFTILAVSPSSQYNLVLYNYFLKNTNTLILEKPIASDGSLITTDTISSENKLSSILEIIPFV
mgnify:CR=1 FL=1